MTAQEEINRIWQWQVDQAKEPIRCFCNSRICPSCPEQGCVMMPSISRGRNYIDFVSAENGCAPNEYVIIFTLGRISQALSQPLVISELELLLKRSAHFPGSLNQDELQLAEELIAVASERGEKCAIPGCIHHCLDISEPLVCRLHAQGLLHRDPQDW